MVWTDFENQLKNSINYSLIDENKYEGGSYSPKILINNSDINQFVLTDIQQELTDSVSFSFSVAFVTKSGIALLKSQLSDLNSKGNRGRILISPYLDFNDPLALKELLKLKNVDVRVSPSDMQLHSKFYLFEQGKKQVLISGSSNLTGNALKKNYEWNIKLTSTDNGHLIRASKEEFNRIWQLSSALTYEWIEKYKAQRNQMLKLALIDDEKQVAFTTKIEPNEMQRNALDGLNEVRKNGAKKAIVVSATGTGKTYLSAFDVQQVKPERVLFIVHREQILKKSLESYQRVLGFDSDQACIFKPGMDISEKKYVFAMIQTLSRPEHLSKFNPELFDYVLIDEVHKAGASSYKTVMDYFNPKFLLGMTATPERTDGQNIYELFDYNLAYEIRLQEALDNDLLCPFIYYGVTDIIIDGELIDENSDFSTLVSEERIRHILDKVNYYGYDGEKVRGLIFCSSRKEAVELSHQFNARGLKTKSLTGDDPQVVREEVITDLESGLLDYILTVDIFNEGIDIPSVNQVVMLRNTQSSIVFIQQLGRGLRKHSSKEYVTIIDFIGNYKNNYLIPIALYGDKSMNKDNLRRDIRTENLLSGLTTINFEEIAKKQIFDSISNTSLSNMKLLKDSYTELENKIGRIPYLIDFLKYDQIDPLVFFENNQFKSYIDVLNKFSDRKIVLNDKEQRFLEFITYECLNGKRKHELLLLNCLLKHDGKFSKDQFISILKNNQLPVDEPTISSVERVLNLTFLKGQEQKRFATEPLVTLESEYYHLDNDLNTSLLHNRIYFELFKDVIESGLWINKKYSEILTIGQKYSRRDVLKLLNFEKDNTPQNIGGYIVDKAVGVCPIFITYHKADDISDTIKYEDEFLSDSILTWYSKSGRKLTSPDVQTIISSVNGDITLPLFVKKDDGEGSDFYYLGNMKYIESSAEQKVIADKPIVKMNFHLVNSVDKSLFEYLTH